MVVLAWVSSSSCKDRGRRHLLWPPSNCARIIVEFILIMKNGTSGMSKDFVERRARQSSSAASGMGSGRRAWLTERAWSGRIVSPGRAWRGLGSRGVPSSTRPLHRKGHRWCGRSVGIQRVTRQWIEGYWRETWMGSGWAGKDEWREDPEEMPKALIVGDGYGKRDF